MNDARRWPLLAVCWLATLPGLARAGEIDDIIAAQMKEQGIPGLSVAVVRDGQVIHRKGYGLASLELNAPATAETIYEIGSITKSFTATLVMKLVEEGKIDLDASVRTYLPDVPEAWKAVTVRHLLNHTSGIKSYTSVGDFQKLTRNDHAPAEIIEMVADAPLEFEPGTKWAYNNTGYYLLGLIVEKAAGRSFASELADRILRPLNMDATRPNNPKTIIPKRSAGYGKLLGATFNRDPITPTSAFSAGFLVSNVDDMLKWAAAQDGDTILTSESRKQMTTPTRLSDGSTRPYGFGWAVETVMRHRRIAHGGGTAGFSTLVAIYPDDQLTIVVLSNLGGANVGAIEKRIARTILPALSLADAPEIEDPDPPTTTRVHDVITRLLKGEIPEADFSADFAKFMATDDARRVSRELAKQGDLAPLVLIDRKADNGSTVLFYRATLGKSRYLITVTLNDQGKFTGLRAEKDD
jgi:D-alanyl-D-alanine carboxypeptidase